MFLNSWSFFHLRFKGVMMEQDIKLTDKERQYTSTVAKLLKHKDRIEEVKKGTFRPISIQLAPTDKCNLNCDFCSVKNRKGDELTLDEVKNTLNEFKKLGALAVELTGGGDPSVYPFINETIEYAHELGYDVGMISNGVAVKKNIKQENLDKLTWLRISLNSLDYVESIDVPAIKGTLGFSYVWNQKTNTDMLDRLSRYAEKYRAEFVRVVPNCLNIEEQKLYQDEIRPLIAKYPKLFFQQKQYKVPGRCWFGYLKPFVTPDGNISRCSANPLIERKFNSKFVMATINDIPGMYKEAKSFDTSNCKEGKCFFKEQNDFIASLIDNKNPMEAAEIEEMSKMDIPHPNFI